MKFECSYKNQKWTGTIKKINDYGSYTGCVIDGRGSSIEMYIGKADEMLWVCFPYQNLSSSLSSPEDIFWNTEKLADLFDSTIDGVTVAEGIKLLSEKRIIN